MNLPIVTAAALLLALALLFEYRRRWQLYLPLKAATSILFVVTALIQPRPLASYFTFLLVGFILCLAGDVLLAVPGVRAFRIGLVAFLLGHVGYLLAFVRISNPQGVVFWAAVMGVLIVGAFVFRWLEPFLGRMRGAVLAYV
ncbi:MAG: lysoplasmalogenase, partial [Opitutae bacterium]|nr:lysoplasmalogenase [Opitutae bacterium]